MPLVFVPFGASGAVGVDALVSSSGQWTVPVAVAIGDVLYVTGSFAADRADNTGVATGPAMGAVLAKPTPATATVVYSGRIAVFAGLTIGAEYFLGLLGGITTVAPVGPPGTVVQRVGVAIDGAALLFHADPTTVVL